MYATSYITLSSQIRSSHTTSLGARDIFAAGRTTSLLVSYILDTNMRAPPPEPTMRREDSMNLGAYTLRKTHDIGRPPAVPPPIAL
ncbi:hypothetical protein VTO73DRAFT_14104 [Trametes versicolor]